MYADTQHTYTLDMLASSSPHKTYKKAVIWRICNHLSRIQRAVRLNSACFLICFHSGLSKLNLLIKAEKWNAEHYWRDANCVRVEIGEGVCVRDTGCAKGSGVSIAGQIILGKDIWWSQLAGHQHIHTVHVYMSDSSHKPLVEWASYIVNFI